MAVQLQLPVGPGGEPVVVVAVEDDRRVRADARRSTGAPRSPRGRRCRGGRRRPAGSSSSSRRRRAGGSARRRSCRRRPRRSGRPGRRGGPGPSRRRRGRRRGVSGSGHVRSPCGSWAAGGSDRGGVGRAVVCGCRRTVASARAACIRARRGHAQRPAIAGRCSAIAGHPVEAAERVEGLAARGDFALAWRTIHGSTRLESSIVTVGP